MSEHVSDSAEWQAVQGHAEKIAGVHLRDLFAGDPRRGERLTAQVADLYVDYSKNLVTDEVISALVDRPHEINTALGNLGAVAHTLAPKVAFRVLHLAYQVFPDSAAARGDGKSEGEQIMLARVLKGIHW